MIILPAEIMTLLAPFRQLVSRRVWDWVQVLVIGAILAPGKRTVTAVLQVMGLKDEPQFQNYHRVLNRVKWSGLGVSRLLLALVVARLVGGANDCPLFLAADETLERRWGKRIRAKGIFRDGKRSSHGYLHFTPALRWLSLMVLASVPWSRRPWALPFLTVLAPSAQTDAAHGQRHKTLIDWLGQMVAVTRRWLPRRPIVLVVDGALGSVKLGLLCRRHAVTLVTRMRLDAVLHAPPRRRGAHKGPRLPSMKDRLADPQQRWQRQQVEWYGQQAEWVELASDLAYRYTPGRQPLPIRWVLVRDPAGQRPPATLMTTDLTLAPTQVVQWFIRRWGVEVTFQEARAHLGLETQRQWSDLAISRTTPALLGLFTMVTLLAHRLSQRRPLPVRATAWYRKQEATFADALALVRRTLWTQVKWVDSRASTGLITLPAAQLHGLVDTLCYSP